MGIYFLKSEKEVLYDDVNISVIVKKGTSDFLFITFGDSTSLASGLSMYADNASSKLGYSSLCFMPKQRNWYPEKSMIAAINICEKFISAYETRIAYSGSMGAYAAIKYSKLLMSTSTIACCPQWSIAPNDCIGIKNKYEKYFSDVLADMKIKEEDIHGKIYIIYDPKHKVDSFHFFKIYQLSSNVKAIRMPYVRHHVTTAVAGTNNVKSMVEAALKNADRLLEHIICRIKRNSIIRQDNLLLSSAVNHPYLTAKTIINANLKSEGAIEALGVIVRNYLAVNDYKTLQHLFTNISKVGKFFSGIDDLDVNQLKNKIFYNTKIIKSFHGQFLVYDPFSKSLRQLNANDYACFIGIYKPLKVISIGDELVLAIENKDFLSPLIIEGAAFSPVNIEDVFHDDECLIKASIIKGNQVCFSSKKKYLTAKKNNQVLLNCEHVKNWEVFTLH